MADTLSPELSGWAAYFEDRAMVEHRVGAGEHEIHKGVVVALRHVFDPEIPVNVYDLGLIYSIETKEGGRVKIQMTLTSPNCPEAETLPEKARSYALSAPGVSEVELELVWDPPWGPERMGEATRLELGFL